MKTKKRFTMFISRIIVLSIFAIPVKAISATLYVATKGSNTLPFNTWAKATDKIQTAIDYASAGDIIIVGSNNTGHGTGIYNENVNVTKSLTIKSESGYEYTIVVASNTDDHVFELLADNVTIGVENCGFSIYGATNSNKAGICIYERTGCIIQGNRCGWDSSHKNNIGIYLFSSSANMLTGNITDSNGMHGISLSSSSYNTLEENTVSSNPNSGIFLVSSSYNTLMGNTASSNSYIGIFLSSSCNNTLATNICQSNNSFGIQLYSSCNNTLTGNTISLNSYNGIQLNSSSNNTLTGNTVESNGVYGIYLYSSSNNNTLTGNTVRSNNDCGIFLYSSSNNNTFYLNNLSNNDSNVGVSSCSGNILNSPTTIYYDYTAGSLHKNYIGNYYSDYTGSDADGDGIGTDPYNGMDMTDNYPLMTTSDHYSLQAWWLNSDIKMYINDMSKAQGYSTVTGGNSHIWIADQATLQEISFSGYDTWTGQMVFTSALANGHTFKVEIGSSTNGSDFTPGGAEATITGTGSATVFTYETNTSAFGVATGEYLAFRITNNSGVSYIVEVGGAGSYCSSPNGSGDYLVIDKLNAFTEYSLRQNYPNPFSTSTLIHYELPERTNVILKVYDVFGREVSTLFEGEQNAGKYEVEFNGTNLPSGIYFYQLQAGEFLAVRKLLLLK